MMKQALRSKMVVHRLAVDARFFGYGQHCQHLLIQTEDHDRLPGLDHQIPPSDLWKEYWR